MDKIEPQYKRVLLKIGGESLLGNRQYGISHEATLDVAEQIKEVHKMKVGVAVVIGAGNIFRGLSAAQAGMDRATADYMGMLATVMNSLALQDALEKIEVPTRVMTAVTMQQVAEPFIRRRAIRHMEKGRVVVLGAGTGSPFFTTDTSAALRALELGVDILLKATKVDGVYDKDPTKYPDAKKYDRLSYQEAIVKNLRVMDGEAFVMCRDNKMPMLVFNLFKKGNLKRVILGEKIGTLVSK
ncbi:MAG: UMP kinase [bacterium]|nr:UMP kinase [bacterium]